MAVLSEVADGVVFFLHEIKMIRMLMYRNNCFFMKNILRKCSNPVPIKHEIVENGEFNED